jgi:rhomboid protease GluP
MALFAMSFQINARYVEQIVFENTAPREIYGLLLEAISLIGWSLGPVAEESITAFPGISIVPFGEVIHMEINHDTVTVASSCIMPQLWSFGQNKRNIRKLGRALNHLLKNRTSEQLNRQYIIASSTFIAARHEKAANERFNQITNSTSKISGFISIFNPKPGYFITPILIDLNILYFLLIGFAGGGFWHYSLRGFDYLGVNLLDLTLTKHQWWRLLSYQFIHAGFLHLIGNMFSLLMIGAYLEPLLGRARFLFFYLLCGAMGGLLSIYMHPFNGSVGASGAILGMYGVFLALLLSDLIEKHTRRAIFSTLIFFIAVQLLSGLQGAVDNSAHVGGLITGFLLGLIAIGGIRIENVWTTAKRLFIILVCSIAIVFFSLKKMPNPANTFRSIIQEFNMNDIRAQHYLSLLDEVSDDEIVLEIKYQSLGFLKQNARVLDRLEQLPIGQNGHYRVNLLRKYLLLQAKRAASEMLWIYYGRRNKKYMDQIHACDTELHRVTYELENTTWTFQ